MKGGGSVLAALGAMAFVLAACAGDDRVAAIDGQGPKAGNVLLLAYDSADGDLHGALALLAQASGGQAYSAGPDDVEPVLLMIWREL